MDIQAIFNIGIGAILMIVGWFARELWVAVKDLKDEIHQIEVDLPSNYVKRDEFLDNMKEIKEMLYKIFEKLESKADKH